MADRETNLANSFETNLSSALAIGATNVNVVTTSGTPAVPFFAVLDPGDDSKREVVLATAKTGTTLTVTRGQDGTSDVAHDNNALVGIFPVAALWTDINDRVEGHDHTGGTAGTAVATASLSGHDKPTHDALGIDAATLDGLDSAAFSQVPVTVAVKTADETVNNSATLQDDDHLTLSVDAGTRYSLELLLDIDPSGQTLDGAFSFPTGTTIAWARHGGSETLATGTGELTLGTQFSRRFTSLIGKVTTGGTAGDLQFRWAQSNAESSDLTLRAGSWMRLVKLS